MITDKELEVLKLRIKGFSQVEVSKRLKISQPAVSHFEKSAYKKIDYAEKINEMVKRLKIRKKWIKKY